LPWFRIRRRKDEHAEEHSATATLEAPAPSEEPSADERADTPTDGDAPRKRKRRGSRGGRGRKKTRSGAEADGSADEAPAAEEKAKPEKPEKPARGQDGRKRSGQSRQGGKERRRQPQRRAPLPAAKRELLITVDVGEQRVALLEDDRVAEVYLERPERRSIAGNIYLGTVDNVLPGMEAAFVEIGLEKNGFLYVDEIVVPELEGKRHGKKITDLIQRGQQILVQAVKDPMKTKGARLTTEISLPGRFLVYVPNGEGLGVSRRLEDSERQRLKSLLEEIAPDEGGVIVRTAAEGASAEDVERDLVFLQRLWKTIEQRAKSAAVPELVYQEAELPLRIVRDLFAGDFVAAHVDSDRTHKRIVGYLKKTSPHMIERVHRTKDKEPLFERFGVEQEIASTLDRRVDLPSGGYLVFDYAEAFTVIDVNTGRFVGSRSKSSAQRLEDTVVKNNLEAVKEVVRQLRLRDIGGIIVIDFIDMANPKNRQAVEDALRQELERDRTKTYVVEISPLGLVEMTRQNVTDGPREVMTRKCPTCGGDGIVVSDATVALDVERKLRALAARGAGSRIQAYRVALHPREIALLAGPGGERLAALEEVTRRRFYLVPAEGHVHTDHFEVLAEGRRDDLAPAAPVEEGAQVEVKLVEIDLHDASAAVGRVDGFPVVVADAAKRVGKKASVAIGRVLEGQAFATLVGGEAPAAPITFESEAEKPTRAPAKRRGTDAKPEPQETAPAEEPEEEPTAEAVPETAEDATEESSAAPRKRTRRGSRGGRRRKKTGAPGEPVAAGTAEAEAEADADAEEAEAVKAEAAEASDTTEAPPVAERAPRRKRAPRIHLPDDDRPAPPAEPAGNGGQPESAEVSPETEPEGDEGQAADAAELEHANDGEPPKPKKRTRRGSRGGRSRRRKTATPAAGAENDPAEGAEPADRADAAVAMAEPEPAGDGDAPAGDGYVPMSEWIDELES
jgi:ribonuclease G